MLIAFAKRLPIFLFPSLVALAFSSHLEGQALALKAPQQSASTLKKALKPFASIAASSPPLAAKKLPIKVANTARPLEIHIDPSERTGKIVTHFGFDLKGGRNLTKKPSDAITLYRDTNANLVRIPFFAGAHKEDGSMDPKVYGPMIQSIQNIKTVNPQAQVFASLKLLKERTFPAWIASNEDGAIFGVKVKRPDPKKYAQLVADYIGLLSQENIAIDFLGLNNECSGALTPDRYLATAKELNRLLKQRKIAAKFRSFQYIGSEGFGVKTSVRYAEAIKRAKGLDFANILGSHYYPDLASGTIEGWTQLTNVANQPIWHTEVHVRSSEIPADNIAKIRDGLAIVFKTNQRGVTGYVWWAQAQKNNFVNPIRRSVINTLRGGSCVKTSGSYQAKNNAKDATLFQATLVDNTVWLWCCNPGAAISDVVVELESRAAKAGQGQFWAGGSIVTAATPGELNVKPIAKTKGRKLLIQHLPATSIGLVKIDLVTKPRKYTASSPLVAEREWNSTNGSKTVLATLISVKNGVGQFRRKTGKSFKYSIENLTPEDQTIVADALKKN